MARARPSRQPRPTSPASKPCGPLVAVQLTPPPLVQAAWRTHPATRPAPVAIAEGRGPVLAASPHAPGVRPGQRPAQARLACPDVLVVAPDPATAALLYEELLGVLATLAPIVEATDPATGLALLDARGCARLWGATLETWDGAPLARAALAALGARGLDARAGCAATRLHAHLLCARAAAGEVVALPHSETQAVVQAWPLADPAFGLDPLAVRALHDGGLTTLGALLAVSPAALAERCGPAAVALRLQVTGDDAPLRNWTAPVRLTLTRTVDGLADRTLLGATLDALCAELHRTLVARGQAAATLRLGLLCDDGAAHHHEARHWPPLQALPALRHAVHALGDRASVAAPITEVELHAGDLARPDARPQGLFTGATEGRRERVQALAAAHARRAGTPLLRRWRTDPLAPDGWLCEEVE